MTLGLYLSGNEPRQRYLFTALTEAADVRGVIPFDDIDPITKYTAALLSFSWPRSEWWENYHMHPLMQRRRRMVLRRGLANKETGASALLLWGSWFPPYLNADQVRMPYFNYIDQSMSLHNLPGERTGRFARRKRSHALQAETYRSAAGVFCMSEWARAQTLDSHSVSPDKVSAVGWGPCGVDLSGEDLVDREREQLVLHVSNDFHRKGIDYLIATAEMVRRVVPAARFVVIGKDSSGMMYRNSAAVEFLGRISDKATLANYFRNASLFFMPHRFDRSPHVLVEAMSAALPLVATMQGGAVELIERTGVGHLCDVGDIGQYAEAIVTLLRQPDVARQCRYKAVNLMKLKYNWPAIARLMCESIKARV